MSKQEQDKLHVREIFRNGGKKEIAKAIKDYLTKYLTPATPSALLIFDGKLTIDK